MKYISIKSNREFIIDKLYHLFQENYATLMMEIICKGQNDNPTLYNKKILI